MVLEFYSTIVFIIVFELSVKALSMCNKLGVTLLGGWFRFAI